MKILNVCPFFTTPPDNGGKTRIHKLNLYLSKKHKVFQFSCNTFRYFGKVRMWPWTKKLNDNYTEYVYSAPTLLGPSYFLNKMNIPPLAYLSTLMMSQGRATWLIGEKIEEQDLIQIEEPWQFDWVCKIDKKRKPVIADTQNVEYALANDPNYFLSKYYLHEKVLNRIFEMEKRYLLGVDLVFAASEMDKNDFVWRYGIDKNKIKIIPNGVDIYEFQHYPKNEMLKKALGLRKNVVFFVGGVHHPNLEALEKVKIMAEKLPEYDFLIAGGIGKKEDSYGNLIFTGPGSHYDMIKYFAVANVALNPMFSGSGTNVKLLQYLAAGLPVITTRFGARGLETANSSGLMFKEDIEGFCDGIKKIIENKSYADKLRKNARRLIIGKYDFESIVKNVEKYYKKIV